MVAFGATDSGRSQLVTIPVMPLINCPDCGREVSNKAAACIHCGCPISGGDDLKELIVGAQEPLVEALPEPTWIVGSEWTLPEDGMEQRVHCLDCDRDVYFPAGQDRHAIHKVEPLVSAASGDFRPEVAAGSAPVAGKSVPVAVSPQVPDIESKSGRSEIQAKQDALAPDDPVRAAELAHDERISIAQKRLAANEYTPDQYKEFATTSEAELRRNVADRGLRPWDWWRIVNFKSRTRRVELWAMVGISLAIWVFGLEIGRAAGIEYLVSAWVVGGLIAVFLLLGPSVNRAHDMGKTGFVVMMYLIPFVNFMAFVWIAMDPGENNVPNRWGPPVVGKKHRPNVHAPGFGD